MRKKNKAMFLSVAIPLMVAMFPIIFGIVQFIIGLLSIDQSVFETFLTAREWFYFVSIFAFALILYDYRRILKILINMELIGCVFYLISFLHGGSISPFAYFGASAINVGGMNIYRDFAPIPLLLVFDSVFLIGGIYRQAYLWNKRRDKISLIAIISCAVLHLFRNALLLLILGIVLLSVFLRERKGPMKISRKTASVLALFLVAIIFIFSNKVVKQRFLDGFVDLQYILSGNELNAHHGTFTYRMWLLESRISYLKTNGLLLWGMGPISSRSQVSYFGSTFDMPDYLRHMYNSDGAYLILIPRYGIVGTSLYILFLLYFVVYFIKRKTNLSLAVAIYIISAILGAFFGTSTLCEYGSMLLGMFIGMGLNEDRMEKRFGNFTLSKRLPYLTTDK